jgi:hypothetical protein
MINADKDFLKAEKLLEGMGVKVAIPGNGSRD